MEELTGRAIAASKFPQAEFQTAPYPHLVIDDFLDAGIHRSIEAEFQAILARGLSERYDQNLFTRQGTYDAYSYVIPVGSGATSSVFYSEEWFRYVQSCFDGRLLPYTLLAYHHHRPFGRNGVIHSDFNLANFAGPRLTEWGLRAWAHEVPYMRFKPTEPKVETHARAVAIIYYLSCPRDWKPGDGGETGLYSTRAESACVKKVEPLSNRLLLFPNSPNSYHRYESNRDWQRNCVIQWFHCSTEDCFKKFGRMPGLE